MSNQHPRACQHYRRGDAQRVCDQCRPYAEQGMPGITQHMGSHFNGQNDQRTREYLDERARRPCQEDILVSYPYPTDVNIDDLRVNTDTSSSSARPGGSFFESSSANGAGPSQVQEPLRPQVATQMRPHPALTTPQVGFRNDEGDQLRRGSSISQNVQRNVSEQDALTPSTTVASSMNVWLGSINSEHFRNDQAKVEGKNKNMNDDSRR